MFGLARRIRGGLKMDAEKIQESFTKEARVFSESITELIQKNEYLGEITKEGVNEKNIHSIMQIYNELSKCYNRITASSSTLSALFHLMKKDMQKQLEMIENEEAGNIKP